MRPLYYSIGATYPTERVIMSEYTYEIFCRYQREPWEHCDYAKDAQERDYLLGEYRLAYGKGFAFKVVRVKEQSDQ